MVILLVVLAFVLIFIKLIYNSRTETAENVAGNTPLITNKVLVGGVTNFDNLTIEDLPSFRDVRGVYSYKNNLIITGIDRIVEYNPNTREFIRQNDTTKLIAVFSTALIGKHLYVSSAGLGKQAQPHPGRIYKIDLDTGDIIGNYFDDNPKVNLWLASEGTDLWASYEGGVAKIDTKSDQVARIYDYRELQLNYPSCPFGITADNDTIKVLSNCIEIGVTTYHESNDNWSYRQNGSFPPPGEEFGGVRSPLALLYRSIQPIKR